MGWMLCKRIASAMKEVFSPDETWVGSMEGQKGCGSPAHGHWTGRAETFRKRADLSSFRMYVQTATWGLDYCTHLKATRVNFSCAPLLCRPFRHYSKPFWLHVDAFILDNFGLQRLVGLIGQWNHMGEAHSIDVFTGHMGRLSYELGPNRCLKPLANNSDIIFLNTRY